MEMRTREFIEATAFIPSVSGAWEQNDDYSK